MPLVPRRTVSVLAVSAAAVAAALSGGSTAAAAPAPAPEAAVAAPSGPGVCPKDGLLNFRSTLTNGQIRLGSSATVSGSTGRACGVQVIAANGSLISRVKPANTSFAPVVTRIGLLQVPTTFRATSVLQGPAGFDAKGLTAVLAGNVVATAEILGQKCAIPLKLRLTTGRSGALTGSSFQTRADGTAAGRLVDGTFAVPRIQPSATCNAVVATLSNTLLGLPLAAGESSISYDGSLSFPG